MGHIDRLAVEKKSPLQIRNVLPEERTILSNNLGIILNIRHIPKIHPDTHAPSLHPGVGVGPGDGLLPHEAPAAVQLHALRRHLVLQLGRPVLDHGGGLKERRKEKESQ